MFTRATDIPEFVADGAADLGITDLDLIMEGSKVKILEDLKFGRAKLVLAAPEDSNIKDPEDIKDGFIIATEFPKLITRYRGERYKR